MIRKIGIPAPAAIVVLLLSELVLLTFCYVLAGYLVLEVDPSTYLLYDGGLARILVVVLAIVVCLHLFDLYSEIRTVSRVALVLEILQAIGVAFIAEALLSYVDWNWRVPGMVMIWGSALALVTLSAWRLIYWHIFLRAFAKERILFVGINPVVEEVSEEFAKRPELGYTNLGYLDDDREPGSLLNGAKVLGPLKSLREIAAAIEPDRIVVGMTERRARMPVQDLLELRYAGIPIEDAASVHEDACKRICTRELRPAQVIFSGDMGPRSGMVALQWFYSAALALASALVLLPVMVLTALAVKLSSRGPVLFRQARVGRSGKVFILYKFRSMYANAEAQTGAVWASKDDPRVTPVGRWLRRTRIDELPQLWNVLLGDMSVVGPRPERPEFVKVLAEKIPYYRQRHCVKPGITGWAQINHKYGDSVEDTITKLEFDLYYIKHISPALDIYILFQTLKTVLTSRGAQ
jgi:sugar transferase (PEP-CTERM system associated)